MSTVSSQRHSNHVVSTILALHDAALLHVRRAVSLPDSSCVWILLKRFDGRGGGGGGGLLVMGVHSARHMARRR